MVEINSINTKLEMDKEESFNYLRVNKNEYN
jgi:hypothetical protein